MKGNRNLVQGSLYIYKNIYKNKRLRSYYEHITQTPKSSTQKHSDGWRKHQSLVFDYLFLLGLK